MRNADRARVLPPHSPAGYTIITNQPITRRFARGRISREEKPCNSRLRLFATTLRVVACSAVPRRWRSAPALAEECRIGPPPHDKGPRVFMDYDQVELDAAYDQSFLRAARRAGHQAARRRTAKPCAPASASRCANRYGPTAVEKLDIYRAQARKGADLRLHPRRRLARRRGEELRLSRRDVRQCRRALRRARFRRDQGGRRRSARDGGAGAPWHRLGLQECARASAAIRDRALYRRPLVGRPSLRRGARHRLAEEVRPARRRRQRRACA